MTIDKGAITLENLHMFSYHNLSYCKKPYRGLIVDFHGLNNTRMEDTSPSDFASRCADRGLIYLLPYYGPWSWMNDDAVSTVDDIIDTVFVGLSLPDSFPILSTGGSMGGLSALVYTRYAKRTPVACAAKYPVCDLVYHYGERPDLPRTLRLAFLHYPCGLNEAMASCSPMHIVGKLPRVPYYIVHGDADKAVNKAMHSDRFVAAMRDAGYEVTYDEVPGMVHGNLVGSALDRFYDFVFGCFSNQ